MARSSTLFLRTIFRILTADELMELTVHQTSRHFTPLTTLMEKDLYEKKEPQNEEESVDFESTTDTEEKKEKDPQSVIELILASQKKVHEKQAQHSTQEVSKVYKKLAHVGLNKSSKDKKEKLEDTQTSFFINRKQF